jgi:hypothetical protein
MDRQTYNCGCLKRNAFPEAVVVLRRSEGQQKMGYLTVIGKYSIGCYDIAYIREWMRGCSRRIRCFSIHIPVK